MDAPDRSVAGLAGSPERLSALLTAVLDVTSSLDRTATLHRIVRTAADLLDARYAALGVLGPGEGLAEFVHVGIEPESVAAIGDLPHGRGLLGELIEHPVPLRLTDIASHPSSVGFPANHPPMTTFVGAPVRVETEVYGNLYLTDKRSGTGFTADDEEVLRVLAAAAGIAIGNAQAYRASRRRVRWLHASAEIRSAVLAGSPVLEVMRSVTTAVAELTGATLVAFVTEEPSDNPADDPADLAGRRRTRLIAAAGPAADRLPAGVAGPGSGIFGRVGAGPAVLPEFGEDVAPAWRAAATGLAALAVPVALPAGRAGLLLCARPPGRRPLGDADLPLVVSFADLAALAVEIFERQRAQRALDLSYERERIAADLHDRVIQRLFATGLTLQAGAARIADGELQSRTAAAVGQIDEAISDLRRSIFDLRHAGVADHGLRQRLADVVESETSSTHLQATVRTSPLVDTVVGPELADQLDAVLRELMSNAVRHSGASSVRVSIDVDDQSVVLEVEDDGVGIRPGGRRSGLRHLAIRAEHHAGTMRVSPVTPDDPSGRPGTRITWSATLD